MSESDMCTRLTGISIPQKCSRIIHNTKPPVAWLMLNTDEYIEESSYWSTANTLRRDYPLALRGMGLSLASSDLLNWQYLKNLKELQSFLDPCLIAEHLAWSSLNGQYFHVPFPPLYSHASLVHISEKINSIQAYLKTPISLENIVIYSQQNLFAEAEFLRDLVQKTGCHVLLNLTHLYINSHYHHTNLTDYTERYLKTIPQQAIDALLLETGNFNHQLINEKEKWLFYQACIKQLGRKPTMIGYHDNTCQNAIEDAIKNAIEAEKYLRISHGTILTATTTATA